ncbi:MAG: DUF885 domain-containing protein [Armatimonadetes bacterium]|nr:DUF885 domain-containing protein [Armatimonadota bacterium]
MPTDIQRFLQEYIDAFLSTYPSYGAASGLHQYDGQIGDYSREAIDARVRALAEFERRAQAIDSAPLSAQERLDLALIERSLRHEQFEWTGLRDYQRNPLAYSPVLDVTQYIKRNYAPLSERVRALTEHLDGVPGVLAQAREHLGGRPIPRPFIETALDVYRGYLTFYEGSLPAALNGLQDRPLFDAFLRANGRAGDAVRDFVGWLTDDVTPRATDDFAIGERLFSQMLATGELVDLPLDRLVKIGEEELRHNREALAATVAQIDRHRAPAEIMREMGMEHPSAATLLEETRRLLDGLRDFLVERDLVTIPSEVRPIVEETPPFSRWAFAMMDTAGPFEEVATESFYYVTPPDPGWPPQQQEEWLTKFDHYTLKDVSIHEAYPGHYVHFLHVKRAPSQAARIFTSYSFVEGWAHYTEELMLEQGVDPAPKFRLAQLAEALVRNVRYLVAIEMHRGAMTLEEATRMFMEHAFMEELPARKEAVRGTFDPGYLNYMLGKLMVRKLRADVQAEQRERFTLRGFHDALLALGAPPLPLARQALLKKPGRDLL